MSLQEGLAEAEVFCRLMVQNKIDDLLDPSKCAELPAGFNYRRLIVILTKYRCCLFDCLALVKIQLHVCQQHLQYFALSAHQAFRCLRVTSDGCML